MELNCGIYQITNLITGDFYIGQSINLKKRFKKHTSELRNQHHINTYLQNAWNKYGESNFEFRILLYCEPFELTRYEQGLVDKLRPKYNICKECVNSPKGIIQTEETKKRISNSEKGKIVSSETRIRMSNSQKGKINNFLGKHHTEETKRKMSEALKYRKFDEDWKKKQSISHLGKKHKTTRICSEETKLKLSVAMKNSWNKRKEQQEGKK